MRVLGGILIRVWRKIMERIGALWNAPEKVIYCDGQDCMGI